MIRRAPRPGLALAAATLLVAGALILVSGALHAEDAPPIRFSVAVADGHVQETNRTLTVPEGATVEIAISTDAPLQLHLHGYDVEATATPDAPATLQFEAYATGRFPLAAHGHDRGGSGHASLLYVEVHPR